MRFETTYCLERFILGARFGALDAPVRRLVDLTKAALSLGARP